MYYLDDAPFHYFVKAFSEGSELFLYVLVQQIISIEEYVLFSIVEAHLYLTALLDQFLYNWLPKTLELNVEVKFEIFQRFRRD
jgi:hypothetical protein